MSIANLSFVPVQPEAFSIYGFTIYWYGIFAALGFMFAFGTASRRAPKEGLTPEAITNMAPWLIGGAIVGARLLYIITFWKEQFADKPFYEVFMLRRSGLVYYGGLVGASLSTILYCRIAKLPLWKVSDLMAPSIALGHAFGRIGCLMTGCCYGKTCSLPWAVHFPPGHDTKGAPVHPTQIYESALNFLLFFGLLWLWKRKKFDGQVFAAYLLCYAVLRSFVERFRGDYEKFYLGGIATPGQTVSIAIFAIGLFLWWKLSDARSPKSPTATAVV